MRRVFFLGLLFCVFHMAFSAMHSWKAFYAGSTGMSEFPEFVAVNIVDDEPVGYFDSRTSSFEYRQKWMEENLGTEYLDRQTGILKGHVPTFKFNVKTVMDRFNQSGGVHTFQNMYGCDWDDESGTTGGYFQFGYDGEDFLILDMKNQRFIAPVQQASITARNWNNEAQLELFKQYFTQECVDWVKKYVRYGKSSLERTVPPQVSLLQRNPSSPVTCHVTGFYPRGVMVTWQKNGQELDVDVELGETVPNGDGTFQSRSHLRVKPEDWKRDRYTCTVQHKSLEQDIILPVTEENIKRNMDIKIRTINPEDSGSSTGIIIGCVVGALILITIAAVSVFMWKKKNSGYGKTSTTDTDSANSDPPAAKA